MRFWKIVGCGLIGTAVGLALGPVLLPVIGAAGLLGAAGTGTAISSLSGAALTSASVAAGGTALTAATTRLGGYIGSIIP